MPFFNSPVRRWFRGCCRLVLCLALVGSLAGCRDSGGGSSVMDPTRPSSPGATGLSGIWVGTLSRPGGLGSIAVRWEGKQDGQQNYVDYFHRQHLP